MNDSSARSKLALGVLAGGVGIALVGVAAYFVLDYSGWPWNLMRDQRTIRPQESPPLGPASGVVPYFDGGWPAESESSFPATSRSVLRGELVFAENCVFCHGKEGRGEGPVASKLQHAPDDLTSWKVQYRTEKDLFRTIARPAMIMPPFDRLEDEEIWSVVHYLRESFRPEEPPPWIAAEGALGESLYEALSCAHCHGFDREEEASGIPPDLAYAGSKLKKEWMVEYLLAPHLIRWKSEDARPEIRMPAFSLTRREAEALAEYLSLRLDRERFPRDVLAGPGPVDEGKEAFESYQCQGCHTLDGEGNKIGPDLSDAGLRLQPAYVYQFLLDPKGVVPGTSMKDMDLWDDEARALVRYLQTLRMATVPQSLDGASSVQGFEGGG